VAEPVLHVVAKNQRIHILPIKCSQPPCKNMELAKGNSAASGLPNEPKISAAASGCV